MHSHAIFLVGSQCQKHNFLIRYLLSGLGDFLTKVADDEMQSGQLPGFVECMSIDYYPQLGSYSLSQTYFCAKTPSSFKLIVVDVFG